MEAAIPDGQRDLSALAGFAKGGKRDSRFRGNDGEGVRTLTTSPLGERMRSLCEAKLSPGGVGEGFSADALIPGGRAPPPCPPPAGERGLGVRGHARGAA